VIRSVVILALLLVCRSASAEQTVLVVVAHAESGLDAVAKRVQAELRSAGHAVTLEQRIELGSCTSADGDEQLSARINVRLQSDEEGAVLAEICVPAQSEQVTSVTIRGHVREDGEFAIVVTEALHGLLAAAEERDEKRYGPPKANSGTNEHAGPRPVELSLASRLALDLPTGGLWLGMVPQLQVPLAKNLSFGAEAFLGFLPIEYSDAEMTLESHLVWARFGLLGAGTFGPVSLGWYLAAGPYANRARAEAVPPRQGGTDVAFGAMIAAGGQAAFPARGRLFVSGSLGVSTLVPRVAYQMSQDVTPEVGQLLLEGGLGLGFRFGR